MSRLLEDPTRMHVPMTGFWGEAEPVAPAQPQSQFWTDAEPVAPTPGEVAAVTPPGWMFWTEAAIAAEAALDDPAGHMARLRERTAANLAGLERNRAQVRRENPRERGRRQEHRAEAVAAALGCTKRGVVRSMLALVQADESAVTSSESGGKTPGAAAVLAKKKPVTRVAKRNTATSVTRATKKATVAKRNADQEELW